MLFAFAASRAMFTYAAAYHLRRCHADAFLHYAIYVCFAMLLLPAAYGFSSFDTLPRFSLMSRFFDMMRMLFIARRAAAYATPGYALHATYAMAALLMVYIRYIERRRHYVISLHAELSLFSGASFAMRRFFAMPFTARRRAARLLFR